MFNSSSLLSSLKSLISFSFLTVGFTGVSSVLGFSTILAWIVFGCLTFAGCFCLFSFFFDFLLLFVSSFFSSTSAGWVSTRGSGVFLTIGCCLLFVISSTTSSLSVSVVFLFFFIHFYDSLV